MSTVMSEAFESPKLFQKDRDLVKILKRLLQEDEFGFNGNNKNQDYFWKAAGIFGTRLLKKVNQVFKIEDILRQFKMEQNTAPSWQGKTPKDWGALLNNLREYFTKFAGPNQLGSNANFYMAIKNEFLKLGVRKYEDETVYEAIDLTVLGEEKGNIVPITTVADGRCFYHAVFLNIYKDDNGTSLPDLLKVVLAIDILTNEENYKTILKTMRKNLRAKEELILMILSKHGWADTFIIECMSLFLDRNIYSYRRLAVTENKYTKDSLFDVPKSKKNPILIAFVGGAEVCKTPNHYIALLKKNDTSNPPALELHNNLASHQF